MSTELAIIEDISEEKWPEVYGVGKVNSFYEKVKDHISKEVPDVSTAKGRAAIASNSGKVSSSKTAVEKPGRAYLKKIKELPKTIETELREFVILMDKLRDDTRQPLTDWEAEQALIEANRLEDLRVAEANRIAEEAANALAIQIESDHEIALLMYADYLRKLEEAAKAAEQQRIEYEARIAAEAAAKATKDTEEKAAAAIRNAQFAEETAKREKAESEARALRVKAEAEAAAVKAKADAELATRVAALTAERARVQAIADTERRIANEKAQALADEAKRAKNRAHAAAINNEVLADIMATGCDEACAKKIIAAIAKKQIRHTIINY